MHLYSLFLYKMILSLLYQLHNLILSQKHLDCACQDSSGLDYLNDINLTHEALTSDLKVPVFTAGATTRTRPDTPRYEATEIVFWVRKDTRLDEA